MFSITKKEKNDINTNRFQEMKDYVLGKEYNLSLVFVSSAFIKKINRDYRSKDKSTDILSFPLGKETGEIFISLKDTKKEALKFSIKFRDFVNYLFIHGLVHLKGFDHGSKMESIENKVCKFFEVTNANITKQNHNGDRPRNSRSKNRGGGFDS